MAVRKAVKAGKSAAKTNKTEVTLRPDGLREGSAGGLLVDTLCRQQGATHEELKAAVGWKFCLPFALKSARQAKVRVRKERDGRVMRYFGSRPS